jgi:hypothetical protein
MSKLIQLLVKAGIEPSKTETISDDLHELKRRKVPVVVDEKSFVGCSKEDKSKSRVGDESNMNVS